MRRAAVAQIITMYRFSGSLALHKGRVLGPQSLKAIYTRTRCRLLSLYRVDGDAVGEGMGETALSERELEFGGSAAPEQQKHSHLHTA